MELGRELVAIDQDVDGVTATIAMHGGNGITKEIVRAQYLVGADGAKGRNLGCLCGPCLY